MSRVAVLMAAHNADATIHEAIRSVLDSTLPCDLVIVDDASRVPVATLLGKLPERVTVLRLDRNRGPAGARNHGIAHCLDRGYDYIAVADADDISYPQRFARQATFLDANPQIGAVSAWIRFFTDSGEMLAHRNSPADPARLRQMMFFNLAVSHAACMFRASTLAGLGPYSERYPVAEDYELLRRIATHSQIACMQEYLTDYRVSSNGISLRRRHRQLWDRLRIQLAYFEPLQWRAWAGALKTASLFLVPVGMITTLKKMFYPAVEAPVSDTAAAAPAVIDPDERRWRILIGG